MAMLGGKVMFQARCLVSRRINLVHRAPALWRWSSTAAIIDTSNLPLHGVRVLDITRVLAGVRSCKLRSIAANLHSPTVRRYWEI